MGISNSRGVLGSRGGPITAALQLSGVTFSKLQKNPTTVNPVTICDRLLQESTRHCMTVRLR